MGARPQIEYDFAHNGDRLLHMLKKQHPDYHPILSIARLAHAAENGYESVDKEGNPVVVKDHELALKAHSTVLRYVEPELKAVEVTIGNQKRRTIEVSLFDEDEHEKRLALEARKQEAIGQVLEVELLPD